MTKYVASTAIQIAKTTEPCWFPRVRGLFFFAAAALVLAVTTISLWQHRFTAVGPSLDLAEIVSPSEGLLVPGVRWESGTARPRLVIEHPGKSIAQRLTLPDLGPVDFLHIKVTVKGDRLVAGEQLWEDGRMLLEWHAENSARATQPDYLISARDDMAFALDSVVAGPDIPPARPVLRIEHLGKSGSLVIEDFVCIPVRESTLWKFALWPLLLGWVVWAALLAGASKSNKLRPWLAAALWTAMATQVILPGPWHSIRPLAGPFDLGPPRPAMAANAGTIDSTLPVTVKTTPDPQIEAHPDDADSLPLGKLPDQGSFMLQIKARIQQARPLLHALLFFGPALVFLFLVGPRRTILLCMPLALGIEAAQYALGFGFDGYDFFDIVCDAAGVVLAIACHAWLRKTKWGKKLAAPAGV